MTWTQQDYQFMSQAIRLAQHGKYTCDPNPRVGCVIVRDNQLIAEGWHAIAGEGHAEVNALNSVADASNSTVYLTLEPCSHYGRTPPCADTLIEAGVKEVIIAMIDPNPEVSGNGVKKLEDAGIKVRQGLLEIESKKLNPGFIKRMQTGKPFVRCKMAMSLDARTALANGKSQWISCEQSRKDVHRIRAASSAIVSSADNIIKDDALLTVRDIKFEFTPPVRVIIDRNLKITSAASLFKQPGRVIIYTEQEEFNNLNQINAEIINLEKSETWLQNVFEHMATEYQINEVLVEAGSTFTGALIEAGLVDELIIYMAPVLFGNDANPLLELKQINQLDDAVQLSLKDVRQIGKDLRLSYQLIN